MNQYIDWSNNGTPIETFVDRRRLDLSLIKVDNKLTQLQLLLDATVDGWGWGGGGTDWAGFYFLFIVLFY